MAAGFVATVSKVHGGSLLSFILALSLSGSLLYIGFQNIYMLEISLCQYFRNVSERSL